MKNLLFTLSLSFSFLCYTSTVYCAATNSVIKGNSHPTHVNLNGKGVSKILTTKGYKPIQTVNAGDSVVAYLNGAEIINAVLSVENITPTDRLYYLINGVSMPGTKLLAANANGNKKKAVQDLAVGDVFYSQNNPVTVATKTADTVNSVHANKDFYLINNKWNLYSEQSIWVNSNNVTHAKLLHAGDTIYDDGDAPVIITSVVKNTNLTSWYRFSISGDHSYIVNGLTLHNASVYWIGGGSPLNWAKSTNWSSSSGGLPNAQPPGSATDVFFDANSGTANSYISSMSINSINCTGYKGTLTLNAGGALKVFSDFTLSAANGMTFVLGNPVSSTLEFAGRNQHITTAGQTLGTVIFDGDGGAVILMDNINCVGGIYLNQVGSSGYLFDTNGKNITTPYFDGQGNYLTVNLNASVITCTGNDSNNPYFHETFHLANFGEDPVVNVNRGTSKIIFTDASSNIKTFDSPFTLYDLQITGGGSGAYRLTALHLHQLIDNAATTAHSLLFYGGGTTTIFDVMPIITGSAGNVVTIDEYGGFFPPTLYCTSGTFAGDYLNINNSHASGGAVWNAGNHSTDGGGNTGWIFSSHSITPVIAYGPPGGTPFSTSYEVGSTAGSFAVTQTGGATYNIPLVIPPGTAGMVPSLSVSYNSQIGDGLLGSGWDLSGLSSISRTGQTPYHDGNIKGVTLDNTDRFLLDGNRLIGYSGTYGSDLAVYGTEAENFSRITSYGNAGGGPAYFLVENKDGSTLEYGRRSDSRIEPSGVAQGGVVLTWLLNKVTDSRGNYMDIYYDERNATGEYRPFYISYSGNAGAGINPYNEIYFTYGLRQDKQTAYVAGHPVQQNVLLTGIEMYAEGVLAHSYSFNYSKNINLHLSEVIEKGSDNKQYNSTKFSYDQNYNLLPELTQINSPAMNGNMIAVDFNGDGFSDIFRTISTGNISNPSSDYMQYINNKDGTFSQYGSSQSLLANYYPMVLNRGRSNTSADLDGDGFDDVLMYKGDTYNLLGQHVNNPSFHALLSNGTTLVDGPIFPFNETHGDSKFILGDFDGDGATDLFVYFYDDDKGYIITFRNGGHQTQVLGAGSGNPANGDLGDSNLEFYTTDLNGDGKQEIFFTFNNPWDHRDLFHVLEFTGTWVIETSQGGYPNGWHKIFPGDFNGDGKTDILTWSNAGPSYWNIGYSLGNGLGFDMVPVPSSQLPNYGDPTNAANLHEYIVADFNGDGKSDILDRGFGDGNGTTPSLTILYSTGKSFIMEARSIFTPLSNIGGSSLLGDYNGDGHQEIIYKYGSNSYQALISFMPGSDVHKVQSITDGLQNTTGISYHTLPLLATQGYYAKGTGAEYPVNDFQKAMMVVSDITNAGCTHGDVYAMRYSYEGAKIHLQGKGFLGFTKVKTTDYNQGFVTENTYNTDMDWLSGEFFQPLLSLNKITTISGLPVSEKTMPNYNFITGSDMALPDNSGKRYYVYASEIHDYDQLHGNFTASTVTQNKYGNVISEESSNNAVDVSSSYVFETKSAWIPSRLVTSTTTTTRAIPSYSRTISFENNGPGGLPSKKTEDTGVITDYTYNSCGLPETTKVSALGTLPVPLTTLTEYDSKKRFITKQTNPKGHIVQSTYEAGYGNVLTQTDPNALVTSHTYDGFGRIATTTPPSPTPVINVSRGWAIDNSTYTCQSYSITTTQSGTATNKQFYDNEGRNIRSETQAFDGSTIFTTKSYNKDLEQLITEGEPNSTTLFTNYEYEPDFRRLKKVTQPGGTTVEYSYDGSTTTIKTTSGSSVRTVTKTTDESGLLVNSTDEGGDITYLYHSSGNPSSITVNGAAPVTMEYDAFGRQTKLTDPDAGVTTYAYDKLGRIVNQQTAKQAALNPTYSTTMTYDELGRVKTKTDPQEGGITYTYDTTNGKGKISSLSGYGVTTRYTYDNLSRVKSQKETIGGSDYTYNYGYDNLNRVITTGYPSAAGVNTFSVTNVYNSSGYLYQTKKTSDGSLIWQCNTMNERGQVMQSLSGNGLLFTQAYSNLGFLQSQSTNSTIPVTHSYTFDPTTGNLANRIGHSGVVENFSYDNLDRFSSAYHITPRVGVIDMTTDYDGGGNITHKFNLGDYAYTGLQPHAVYQINSYAGDSLPPQNIDYTAFNKVKTISEGTYTATISYGPGQQRTKMVIKNNGTTLSTKYYVGNYEKIIAGNVTRELHYVGSAVFVRNTTSGAVKDSMYYIQTDHQGSIVAVFAANGNILAKYSYDVWGRRRNYADLTYTLNPSDTLNRNYFGRFYTGHETISQFGLINMNGRMYDPFVARMLSPDNYVQAGGFTQSYNRYSYVLNNPLRYTDPTGNFLAVPFFAIAFSADYLSNVINGYNNPGKLAYSNSMNTLNGMSNCMQFPVYQNSNTKITAGLDPFALGVSVNARYTNGDFTFSEKAGYGFFSGPSLGGGISYTSTNGKFHAGISGGYSNTPKFEGWYGGAGGAFTTKNGMTFGYAGNYYGGDKPQYASELSFSKGDFSLKLNEDYGFSDKYRTGGIQFGIGQFNFGGLVYTNDPGGMNNGSGDTRVEKSSPIWGPNTGNNTTWEHGEVLFAPTYIGISYGNTIDRIGFSAPGVQDILQNGAHHLFSAQNYYLNYDHMERGWYGYNGYNNPYSIY